MIDRNTPQARQNTAIQTKAEQLQTLMKLLAELPNLTSLRIQHVDVKLAAARPTALARLRSWLRRRA